MIINTVIIITLFAPAFVGAVLFLLWWRERFRPQEAIELDRYAVKPFSVTEYLDRMERESLKLAGRRERYVIVLWWGHDGLRLNEDGTTEWISRKPEPPPQIDYSMCNTIVAQSGLQNAICNTGSIAQAQIQLQNAQLQALQTAQIQNMINCIRPAPYPAYLIQQTYSPNYLTYPGGCFGTHQS